MEGSPPQAGRLTVGVPKETVANENRVALIPDTVKRLTAAGLAVLVEAGAGQDAFFSDEAFQQAGATIVPDARTLYEQADVVVKIHRPMPIEGGGHEADQLRPGTILIAFLSPYTNPELVERLAKGGVTAMSMDAIPRTTRAQYMDALSSMATVAGYKAVLMAANATGKFFPLLMTAAGTVPPAKVLVLGAGVAGLQAIGTARRLGAVVEAFDIRAVVKEQVESLGAKFIELPVASGEGTGGYARELPEEQNRRTRELLHPRAIRSDIIITTAAIPGRPAPKLIAADTVQAMNPGSVIVDLAAETGGNCELTAPGDIVFHNGVAILGPLNLPSTMPVHASQMYAKNVQNLLDLVVPKGTLNLDFNDEIIGGMCITHGGEIVHEETRKRMGLQPLAPPPAPEPVPEPEPEPEPAAMSAPPDVVEEVTEEVTEAAFTPSPRTE